MLHSYDLDSDPMPLILDLGLDILKMPLHSKNTITRSELSKVKTRTRQIRHRQIDAIENITAPVKKLIEIVSCVACRVQNIAAFCNTMYRCKYVWQLHQQTWHMSLSCCISQMRRSRKNVLALFNVRWKCLLRQAVEVKLGGSLEAGWARLVQYSGVV